MNIHLEAFARTLGLFLSIYFTTKWAGRSPPAYDIAVVIIAVIAAISLALFM